jgi:hypothetical protein
VRAGGSFGPRARNAHTASPASISLPGMIIVFLRFVIRTRTLRPSPASARAPRPRGPRRRNRRSAARGPPRQNRHLRTTGGEQKRAVELVAEGEEERNGEKVAHVKDTEHGYEVAGVSPMSLAVGGFIAPAVETPVET